MREEDRDGNCVGCSPEGACTHWVLCLEAFMSLLQAGNFRSGLRGGFQQNIHQFSRCAFSGFWSPLFSRGQGRELLVIIAGSGITDLVFLLFWT